VLKYSRRDFDRVTKLPPEFVSEKARHSSKAFHAVAECKAKSDFAGYAPFIEQHIKLAKPGGQLIWAAPARLTTIMIDRHDPGMTAAVIEGCSANEGRALVPLMREIVSSPVKAPNRHFRGFPGASNSGHFCTP